MIANVSSLQDLTAMFSPIADVIPLTVKGQTNLSSWATAEAHNNNVVVRAQPLGEYLNAPVAVSVPQRG